jgi:sugar lactone lactonase YvrE
MARLALRALAAAGALTLACAAPALAVPTCTDAPQAQTILTGQGSLESVITGPDRALYYTDTGRKALMRLAAPGAQPTVVADGIEAPGGLLVGADRRSIIVGYGDGIIPGAIGNIAPQAGLYRVDLATGEKTTLATGLSMANGLATGRDGTIYASSDVGTGIDRIAGGQVTVNWARVLSPNGLAVDSTGRYLFANQTFQPAAIQRVDLTDPSKVTPYVTAPLLDIAAGLDGLTIDQDDRLFAAANQSGEVWRIGTDRQVCVLARGLRQPSAVAFGEGGAFPAADLYAVGFGGVITRIPGARPAPPRADRAPRRRGRCGSCAGSRAKRPCAKRRAAGTEQKRRKASDRRKAKRPRHQARSRSRACGRGGARRDR